MDNDLKRMESLPEELSLFLMCQLPDGDLGHLGSITTTYNMLYHSGMVWRHKIATLRPCLADRHREGTSDVLIPLYRSLVQIGQMYRGACIINLACMETRTPCDLQPISSRYDILQVSAGYLWGAYIAQNGTVYVFAYADYTATLVDLGTEIASQLSCGTTHGVVVTDSGKLYRIDNSNQKPVHIHGAENVMQAATYDDIIAYVTWDGELYQYDGETITRVPIKGSPLPKIRQVICGNGDMMALSERGEVYTMRSQKLKKIPKLHNIVSIHNNSAEDRYVGNVKWAIDRDRKLYFIGDDDGNVGQNIKDVVHSWHIPALTGSGQVYVRDRLGNFRVVETPTSIIQISNVRHSTFYAIVVRR